MKNNLLTLATILTIGLFTNNVTAQGATTAAATDATATIVQPLTITETAELNFGTIMTTAAAGNVVLATDGTRVANLGALLSNDGVGVTNAEYHVVGPVDALYHVNVADFSVTGPGTAMLVHAFTTEFLNDPATGTLTLGEDDFKLGATIDVGPSQTAGVYTGTFNVSVDYN